MSAKNPSVTVDVPPVKGAGGKVLGALATATPQVTGESVQTTLEVLDKVGVKDNIEEVIQKVDRDTPEQREEEEKKITRRIYRIELLLSFFLYYIGLIIQWLTLLGISNSFGDFLYNVFIGSLIFSQWDFSNISTVGKISGATISLQIILFIISNIIVLFYRRFHPSKQVPAGLNGPVYYNGIFKVFNALKPEIDSYNSSVKRLDAQFSQILGAISQTLVIIAASSSASNDLTSLNEIPYSNNIDTSYLLTGFENNILEVYQVAGNEQSIAIRHAAGYAKTTLLVAVLAIIMTSLMNIINWMVGIWKINKDEFIIYAAFKVITRIITCYPCFHDKLVGADKNIDDKTNRSEMEALDGMNTQKKPPLKVGEKNTLTAPDVQTLINNTISGPNNGITEGEKQQQQEEEGSSSNEKKPDENKSDEKKSDENKNKSSSGGLNIFNSIGNLFGKKEKAPGKEDTADALNNIITTVSGTSNNNDEKSPNIDVGKIASEGVKVATSAIEGQKQSGSTDTKPSDIGKLASDGIQVVGNIIDGGSNTKLDASKIVSDGVKVATSAIEGQKQSGSTDTKSSDVGKLASDGIQVVGNIIDGGSDTKLDASKIVSDGVKVATSAIEGQKQSGSTDTKPSDAGKLASDGIQVVGNIIDGGSDTKLDASKIVSDGVKVATSAIEGQKQSGSTKTS